ncbi:hypothetical protein MUK42_23246 [Musa troglodytarum]|uniref:Uncharacterized protein n=1 Tax=Musa troglodytarum TaxID=320322 RepID=A0A9E7EGW3_9LILI|nr:hypothetical protein MUK42_23246 [Musa troglodytarum]
MMSKGCMYSESPGSTSFMWSSFQMMEKRMKLRMCNVSKKSNRSCSSQGEALGLAFTDVTSDLHHMAVSTQTKLCAQW